MRTLAASAGYMVAAAGDRIVAGESSITGSIGVIFQYPQVKDLMDKVGVSLEEIKSAPLKAEPSPFHPASDDAKTMIRAMVMDSYDWFVDLVAERRKLPRTDVLRLADGSIFTGRQALAAKLVDTLGGPEAIRAYLDTRKVAKDLPFVDYEPTSRSGIPFIGGSIRELARSVFGLSETSPGMEAIPSAKPDDLFQYRYRFKTLSLDGLAVNNPLVYILPDAAEKAFRHNHDAKMDIDAIYGQHLSGPELVLGTNVLSKLHLFISYKEKVLYLTAADAHQ